MKLPSLHARLGRSLVVISLVWGLAVAAVVWASVRHEIDELMDNTLQESAEIIFGLLGTRAGLFSLTDEAAPPMPAPEHAEHLIWQVVNARQVVLLRSHRAPEEALVPAGTLGFADGPGGWRVYGMRFAGPVGGVAGLSLLVAHEGREREEVRFDATAYIVGASLAVGLVCALWLRARIRRELQPLAELSQAVRDFDPLRDRDALPAVRIAELAAVRFAIADLARRLAKRVDRERAFAAHAAHALRTPLAGLDSQLAVALREAPPALRPRLLRSREALVRLRGVVNALLTLFRTGSEPNLRSVTLAEVLTHVPFDGMTLLVRSDLAFVADPDLLVAALVNLVDNAHRHGASRVTLGARREGNQVVIEVADDGQGFTDADRQRLQEAIDAQAYTAMNGLGLMLADLVVRAHGGSLRLLPNRPGATVALRLDQPISVPSRTWTDPSIRSAPPSSLT